MRFGFEVLADGGEESAQTLQRLLVAVNLGQLSKALVHDAGRQHLQLVELADEADVAHRPAPGPHLFLLPGGLEN